jgi:hypothetical protein
MLRRKALPESLFFNLHSLIGQHRLKGHLAGKFEKKMPKALLFSRECGSLGLKQ